jgi:polyhydroxybutyrate depolymerase
MKLRFVLLMLLLAPLRLTAQRMDPQTLQINGSDRTYLLHLPTGDQSGRPLPLVLVLHGAQMTSALMAEITGLNAWADKEGFIVVYPQGLEQHWNTIQEPGSTVDDFAFIKALIANIEKTYSVDRSRLFAAGLSNGAEFAQELGCSDDFRFKAIVAISATLQVEGARHCAPKHTVRMIQFHGTADPIVPYLGGVVAAPRRPVVISVADDLVLWQRLNHCAPEPKTERLPDKGKDGTHVERVSFQSCASGGELTHFRILGGGHVWPGYSGTPKVLGQTTNQIDASQYIAHLVSNDIDR